MNSLGAVECPSRFGPLAKAVPAVREMCGNGK